MQRWSYYLHNYFPFPEGTFRFVLSGTKSLSGSFFLETVPGGMNVYTCFGEVSNSGGGKCGKSCYLHRYRQVVTPDWASSLELWHAAEDNRGKLQRKALLWLRPELLSFVCGGREDSQAHYLEGRTTSVGEVQEKALHAWSKAWENLCCLSPREQSQKALFMCLSLWAPEHHLYPNFYYHTCPEMQPPYWTEKLMPSSHLR